MERVRPEKKGARKALDNPRAKPENWAKVLGANGETRIRAIICEWPKASENHAWGFAYPTCALILPSGVRVAASDIFFNVAESKGIGRLEKGDIVEATVMSHNENPSRLCAMDMCKLADTMPSSSGSSSGSGGSSDEDGLPKPAAVIPMALAKAYKNYAQSVKTDRCSIDFSDSDDEHNEWSMNRQNRYSAPAPRVSDALSATIRTYEYTLQTLEAFGQTAAIYAEEKLLDGDSKHYKQVVGEVHRDLATITTKLHDLMRVLVVGNVNCHFED